MYSVIKNIKQIVGIRTSGKYLTELLYKLHGSIKPGMSLLEIEAIAEQFMQKNKIRGAFKGYEGFPANLCLSVNECVVHGIPSDYVLQTGDFLKVDCGVIYDKCISDAAFSIVVGGEVANPQAAELARVTKEALDTGVQHVYPGASINLFGQAVYEYVTSKGFTVLKNLTGHGVGTLVHEQPYIYNYAEAKSKGVRFEKNMVVALEPITAYTSTKSVEKPNVPRNLYTEHDDQGAHREYTVIVTDNGPEVVAGIQEL